MKQLLSAMFVFTAVIRSAEVGTCTYFGRGGTYETQCIKAHYDVYNGIDALVSHGTQDGNNWEEIKHMIQVDLNQRQVQVDEDIQAQHETIRMRQVAKEIIGAQVKGELK